MMLDRLNALKIKDLRKIYRSEVSVAERSLLIMLGNQIQ